MQNFTRKEHEKFKKYFKIKNSPQKWDNFYIEKTNKFIKYIKWIPGIKMVGIWNSISMNCSKKTSDIDLYIVTKKNRLWLVRILSSLVFQVLWVRKTIKKHEWRFCLSFFSTLDWMDFSEFALEDDIYLYFWSIYFKPILDYDNTYSKFIEVNKSWAKFDSYKNILDENRSYIKYSSYPSLPLKRNLFKRHLSKILDLFDVVLKRIFLPKTKKSFTKLEKPFWVVISDDLLKFHDKDIRKKIKSILYTKVK